MEEKKEIEKGKAIKSQQAVWNKLCESRIKLQKLLILSNKLPQFDSWRNLQSKGGIQFMENQSKGYNSVKKLLNNLLTLQAELSQRNPEMYNLESEVSNLPSHQWSEIIQKWDEKTQLSTGRTTQKSFMAFNNSAMKQIEQVHDPEIYDDDDFYRQLVKDIIESRSGMDSAVLRKQMEIQKIRNKIRKKVDTKASKGRKLRYDVHPYLLNFMAPEPTATITDEARLGLLMSMKKEINIR